MINIDSWQKFQIKDLFIVRAGKGDSKNTDIGNIPYISSTVFNNGISKFVSCDDSLLENPNTITINRNGSVGECFYHDYNYVASLDDVRVLIPINFKLDKYIALFIITIIRFEKYRYNYGKKFGTNHIKNTLIKLPTKHDGKPNWDFISNYIKNLLEKNPVKIKQAIENKDLLKKPLLIQKIPELNIADWKLFKYKDIFTIKRGKRLKSEDRERGGIKYFSASFINNGLTDMISNPLFIEKNGLIYTTFGDCFFVESEFTASDEITIFKHSKLNKYNGLFLATVIKENKYKYQFGRKAFYNKFKYDTVKLPVDDKGNPDWNFMENYIKSLPYSSIF